MNQSQVVPVEAILIPRAIRRLMMYPSGKDRSKSRTEPLRYVELRKARRQMTKKSRRLNR